MIQTISKVFVVFFTLFVLTGCLSSGSGGKEKTSEPAEESLEFQQIGSENLSEVEGQAFEQVDVVEEIVVIESLVNDDSNDLQNITFSNLSSIPDFSLATQEDVPLAVSMLGANFSIVKVTQGSDGGLVELLESNLIRYTPKKDFSGNETFVYSVDVGNDEVLTARIAIKVESINDSPVVIGESINMLEDESLVMTDLLTNDSDVEGDVLAIASVSQGDNGGLVEVLSDGSVQYTPKANFYGTEIFSYVVADGNGAEVEGVVTAQVGAVNDQPIAGADSFSVTQSQEMILSLLDNDQGTGDGVTFSLVTEPTKGTVTENADGSVSYLPNGDYFGPDSFSYQLVDADGETSVASVALDVVCVTNCTHTFKVSWDASASAGVTGYKVYVGQAADNLSEVFEVGNVTQIDHLVAAKGEYFYSVSAVNDQAIESELTTAVQVVF